MITMGISRILEPILNAHNIVGIIEPAPRNIKTNQRTLNIKVLRSIYLIFKQEAKTLKSDSQEKIYHTITWIMVAIKGLKIG